MVRASRVLPVDLSGQSLVALTVSGGECGMEIIGTAEALVDYHS